jgi:hypothetical protein
MTVVTGQRFDRTPKGILVIDFEARRRSYATGANPLIFERQEGARL